MNSPHDPPTLDAYGEPRRLETQRSANRWSAFSSASEGPSPWQIAMVEAEALRRQTPLLLRHVAPRVPPLSHLIAGADVVFFVHGVLATAGVFSPIEEALVAAGVRLVGSFSYQPWRTVASIAEQLRDALTRVPRSCRVHLVGHSLGGIASRYFVQELSGDWVTSTTSLASPFYGTALARWLPLELARELRPGSTLLHRLVEPTRYRVVAHVAHTSVGAWDDVVCPVSSAMFPTGERLIVDGVGHNGLLFDRRVADAVVGAIARAGRGAVPPPSSGR